MVPGNRVIGFVRAKMSFVGAACCAMLYPRVESAACYCLRVPIIRTFLSLYWMNFVSDLSSGGESLGCSAYCALVPYFIGAGI